MGHVIWPHYGTIDISVSADSLTYVTPWAALKDSLHDFPDIDHHTSNGLTNTINGVLIGNNQSSQMCPATIWSISMDMYSSDITEVKLFSSRVSSKVIQDECPASNRMNVPVSPNYSHSKQSALHEKIFGTWDHPASFMNFHSTVSAEKVPRTCWYVCISLFRVQYFQFLPCSACSPDIPSNEHVRKYIGRRLSRTAHRA